MGNNDLIRNLLIAAAIFFTVLFLMQRLVPQPTAPGPQTTQTDGTAAPTGGQGAAPGPDGAPLTGEPVDAAGGFVVVEGDTEARTVMLGDAAQRTDADVEDESPYRMAVTVSNLGASIESAVLSDHVESKANPQPYRLLAPVPGTAETTQRSLAVEKVIVDGTEVALTGRRWSIEKHADGDSQQAILRIALHRGDAPVIEIERTFTLPKQTVESHRRDLHSHITVTNRDDKPHSVILVYRGGVGVERADNFRDSRVVDWGVLRSGVVEGSRETVAGVAGSDKHSRTLHPTGDPVAGARLSWAAVANKYFTCILAPAADGPGSAPLTAVEAVDLDHRPETVEDVTVRFVTAATSIEPGGSRAYAFDAYIGAKDPVGFKRVPEYVAHNYYFQIAKDIPFCTFVPLVELMIWLLNALYAIIPNYGIAIIILVLLVRTMLHPITKKGQVNMVRMQQRMGDLAPKLEEIKKKYGNDKARMQQETMRIYREERINPAGQMLTCLPMFIQMPIWVALWISLNANIAMRLKPFFWWIDDLTAPDALHTFSSPISLPLLGELPHFNLLPFLLAIAMYFQQKLMPKPKPNPNATEQQIQQQQMMQKMGPIMAVMMLFIFYKAPSGLTLYIMFSTIFGAIEQHRIRKHIKEREEAGTLHKKPPRKPGDTKRPPGPMGRWVERLQQAAEQAQKSGPRSRR